MHAPCREFSAAFNADPHLTQASTPELIYRAKEANKNNWADPDHRLDPLAVTKQNTKAAAAKRHDIYRLQLPSLERGVGHVAMLGANMKGLTFGHEVLVQELADFFEHQPAARVTFIVPERDELHGPELISNSQEVVRHIASRHPGTLLRVVGIPNARHSYGTAHPRFAYTLLDTTLAA